MKLLEFTEADNPGNKIIIIAGHIAAVKGDGRHSTIITNGGTQLYVAESVEQVTRKINDADAPSNPGKIIVSKPSGPNEDDNAKWS
ncbi:MAG: hypothetical protein EOP52_00895 [Sphingobacteriales bacterium]|nr:MAG: hypothetical protein EOP52_00895 [Sphingobacteriales bacterium]